MADLKDILASLDEDDAAAIRAEIENRDMAIKLKDRDVLLATNDKLIDRYPRAWKAYKKGRLKFGDDALDEESIAAILKDKEEELAELGVPLPKSEFSDAETAPAQATQEEAEEDPAAAFNQPIQPTTSPRGRNLLAEAMESLKGNTQADRDKYISLVAEMNAKAKSDPNIQKDLRSLTEMLSAPPIPQRHAPLPI